MTCLQSGLCPPVNWAGVKDWEIFGGRLAEIKPQPPVNVSRCGVRYIMTYAPRIPGRPLSITGEDARLREQLSIRTASLKPSSNEEEGFPPQGAKEYRGTPLTQINCEHVRE